MATSRQAASCGPPGWRDTIGRKGWWKEKIANFLNPLVFTHQTVFAPGYTDEAFDSLRLGASQDEVERQLGPPLKRWNGSVSGCEYWGYSTQATYLSNYLYRALQFDSSGALARKRRYFYVD